MKTPIVSLSRVLITITILFAGCFLFFNSCKKSANLAVLTTENVTGITRTSAISGGNITSDGGASIESRGICWSTSQNPTISDSYSTDGSGTGIFESTIMDLSPNTTYYVRAYATNIVGTAYGNQVSFKTMENPQGANEVYIQDMAFNPVTITVDANTTVIWTNKDTYPHTVTSDIGSFDSGTIAANGTYSHKFTLPGSYAYHCSIHSTMKATVVVN